MYIKYIITADEIVSMAHVCASLFPQDRWPHQLSLSPLPVISIFSIVLAVEDIIVPFLGLCFLSLFCYLRLFVFPAIFAYFRLIAHTTSSGTALSTQAPPATLRFAVFRRAAQSGSTLFTAIICAACPWRSWLPMPASRLKPSHLTCSFTTAPCKATTLCEL